MHGRPRLKPEQVDKLKLEAQKKKIELYVALKDKILTARKQQLYDSDEIFEKLSTIILISPEFNTLWNYRREILSKKLSNASIEKSYSLYEKELQLTESILKEKNIKSYQTWYHRLWTVQKILALPEHPTNANYANQLFESELQKTAMLLKFDERNFHCWNYRRTILKLFKANPDRELEFLFSLISDVKSFDASGNYSAWHNRASLLDEKRTLVSEQEMQKIIEEEFDHVMNMFYVAPKDQSCWIYHRWLLHTKESKELNIHQRDLDACQELIQITTAPEEQKWALITATILQLKSHFNWKQDLSTEEFETVLSNIDRLLEIDSLHVNYYKDLKSDLIIERQLATNHQNNTILLHNLQLTRFDTLCHQTLFQSVQHLNLSNNSILFIPSCIINLSNLESLDLSNNQIEFIEHLNQLSKLKKVNLENNKISQNVAASKKEDSIPSSLEELQLANNPVCTQKDFLQAQYTNCWILQFL